MTVCQARKRASHGVMIATRCIEDDLPLLYCDRDFAPFVEHLGLHHFVNISFSPRIAKSSPKVTFPASIL